MFLDLFERHYVNGKEKKVLSEQKRPIGAEKTFQVCYDIPVSAERRFQKVYRLVQSN